MKPLLLAAIYLVCAWLLELAVFPQISPLLPSLLQGLMEPRLLALAGILFGLMRGEMTGLGVGIAAACLLGFSQPPGYLGAAVASYGLAGFAAGSLARLIGPRRFLPLAASCAVLLLVQWLAACIVRVACGYATGFGVPWLAVAAGCVLGALAAKALTPLLKVNLAPED